MATKIVPYTLYPMVSFKTMFMRHKINMPPSDKKFTNIAITTLSLYYLDINVFDKFSSGLYKKLPLIRSIA